MVEKEEGSSENFDILIDYRLGNLNLKEASKKLSISSGLSLDAARKYIKGMNRDNLIDLKKWREKS